MNIIGKTYQKYQELSSRSTYRIANVMGYECDIYFPVFNNIGSNNNYENVSMFSTHEPAGYASTPDLSRVNFYIPHLVKKQVMNSTGSEFETFYLDEDSERPFIELHPSLELPIQSKVVVYFTENSTMNLFIEKKTVVPGSIFLRMYLNPLV